MDKISIHKITRKRLNAFAIYTDEAGARHPTVPRDLLEWVDPPQPPADYRAETHGIDELDDAPYVAYPRKSQEQIDSANNAKVQAQIVAMEGGNPYARVTREYLITDFASKAALAGVTLEQLLDKAGPEFSPGFAKLYEHDQQIAGLRRAIIVIPEVAP
ncbi:MAG: hypothetical protein KKC70_12590 [Gammaproteobacteria bacterium]|nr:hypothetical protein [Gammaproteobacteria bacterium]